MKEVIQENSGLEEEYLDCLVKLAFDLDDLEKEQQVREEAADDEMAPDEFTSRRIWQMAQEKMDRYEQEEKRSRRRSAVKRIVPQVLKTAACLLLAISIGVPVVIASSAEIRSRVIQMLISIDQEKQQVNFDLAEDPDKSFAVPAEWNGEYYVSYIPEGMAMVWFENNPAQVEYADLSESGEAKRFFNFEELSVLDGAASGTEGGTVTYAEIGGRQACVIEYSEDNAVSITWQNDEKMFKLFSRNMTVDETLTIARNVRKIIR